VFTVLSFLRGQFMVLKSLNLSFSIMLFLTFKTCLENLLLFCLEKGPFNLVLKLCLIIFGNYIRKLT